MKALVAFVCSGLGLAVALVLHPGTAAAQAETCWLVFYVNTSGDVPDEIICLKSETEGYVRETTIFGSGIHGCNTVTANRSGGAIEFVVDYSKCTNNAPSHAISCPSPEGERIKCVWRMLDGSMEPSDAYLEREK